MWQQRFLFQTKENIIGIFHCSNEKVGRKKWKRAIKEFKGAPQQKKIRNKTKENKHFSVKPDFVH